jgi:hypothetical protein
MEAAAKRRPPAFLPGKPWDTSKGTKKSPPCYRRYRRSHDANACGELVVIFLVLASTGMRSGEVRATFIHLPVGERASTIELSWDSGEVTGANDKF